MKVVETTTVKYATDILAELLQKLSKEEAGAILGLGSWKGLQDICVSEILANGEVDKFIKNIPKVKLALLKKLFSQLCIRGNLNNVDLGNIVESLAISMGSFVNDDAYNEQSYKAHYQVIMKRPVIIMIALLEQIEVVSE